MANPSTVPADEGHWPKLDCSLYEEFIRSFSESCHHNEDILRRTRELLDKTPSNTLSAIEVVVRVMEDARQDAAKIAIQNLSGRCTR